MGFLGELLDKKERKAVVNDIDKLLRNFDVKGLEGLIEEMYNVKDLGIFDQLLDAFQDRDKIVDSSVKLDDNDLQILARRDLKLHQILPLFSSVDYLRFKLIYKFFEVLYYISTDRMLAYDDLLNVYFSGLDRRVIFGLDEFDKLLEVPKIPDNYFTGLREVKWSNKGDKKFLLKLNKIRTEIAYGLFGTVNVVFPGAEDNLLFLLAACSYVKEDRNKINKHDVIIAYKSYLKLLQTDITEYKAIKE